MKKTAKEDILREAKRRVDAAWQHDRENREDAYRDLRFRAGDQWPVRIRQQREADNRPTLTINRIPQFVNQVVNDVRQNPPAIKATPADGATQPELAEIYTGLMRQIQYRSGAQYIYSQTVDHTVTCGIGHLRVETAYVDDASFDQEILIKPVAKPLSVYWDPAAVMPDRSDAKWCVVTEMMPVDDFKDQYPDAKQEDFDTNADIGADSGLYWQDDDHVRLAEYWRMVPVKRTLALFEDKTTIDITDLSKADLAFLPKIIRQREVDTFKVEQYILSGAEVLEGPNAWAGKYIPIIPVVGSEVPLETKTVRYGLVRFARDPQQLYNYWRSAAAEAIALAPKSPFLVTPQMIGKFKTQWDTHNTKNRPYLLYEPDPNAPGAMPQRSPAPEPPVALIQESAIASDDMKGTTGIYDAALGNRSNEQSGRAILARQREGDVGTFHFQDNLNMSLTRLGVVLVDLIPRIYDTEREIAIIGADESEEFVPINKQIMSDQGEPILLNDLSQGRLQVRVKIGPSYTTKRIEAADSMVQFAQAVPQSAAVMGDLIAKNMDWPGSDEIAERLKRAIPPEILGPEDQSKDLSPEEAQAKQMKDQIAQALSQMQFSKAKAEVDEAEASARLKNAQVALTMAQIEKLQGVDSLKTAADAAHTRALAADRVQQAESMAVDNLLKQHETFGTAIA